VGGGKGVGTFGRLGWSPFPKCIGGGVEVEVVPVVLVVLVVVVVVLAALSTYLAQLIAGCYSRCCCWRPLFAFFSLFLFRALGSEFCVLSKMTFLLLPVCLSCSLCVRVFSAWTKAAIFGLPQTAIIIAATYRGKNGWRGGVVND